MAADKAEGVTIFSKPSARPGLVYLFDNHNSFDRKGDRNSSNSAFRLVAYGHFFFGHITHFVYHDMFAS